MFNFWFLDEAASTAAPAGGNWLGLIISFGLIAVVFYFFMYRPQKKQDKQNNQMRSSLAVGDEVTTIGGIVGRVVSVKEDTFVLETTKDRTKIRFLRSALRSIDVKADGGEETKKENIDQSAIPQVELKEDNK
ncbi:MAG: preprotein translocase subunit YajC [Ruminococcus sp.]|nr:preprotein translocase subunit YajC [Candidatus Apopatosoma intestinale]